MRLLEDSATVRWFEERGVSVSGSGAGRDLSFTHAADGILLSVGGSTAEKVLLSRFLINGLDHEREEAVFAGGLLWLSRWDIGSDAIEAPGLFLTRRLWVPGGDSSPVLRFGQLFGVGDFVAAQAAVALPLLFSWDAQFMPESGDYYANLSHEGTVEIVAHKAVLERIKDQCAVAGLKLSGDPPGG